MKVQFSLRIDEDLLKSVKMEALQSGESVSDCIIKNMLYGISFNGVSVNQFDDVLDYSNTIDTGYLELEKKYFEED